MHTSSRALTLNRFLTFFLSFVLCYATHLDMRAQEILVTNCTEVDFRAAVNSNQVIRIVCDGTITLTSPLVIASTKVIDGTGHSVTLSGGNTTRLFEVIPGGDLTFSNLTITQGRVQGTNGNAAQEMPRIPPQNGQSVEGGAITVSNAYLKAFNCVFTSCSANGGTGGNGLPLQGRGGGGTAVGGVISARSSSLLLSNCVFRNNVANAGWSGFGGFSHDPASEPGIGRGGVFVSIGGTSLVLNCKFTNNSATSSGGAIDTSGGSGLLTVLDSVFARNNSAFNGGAIQFNGGTLEVQRTLFVTNTALGIFNRLGPSSGGALCMSAGTGRVGQCSFSFNRCTGSPARQTASAPTIQSPAVQGRGGAVAVLAGELMIAQCAFGYNAAAGGNGIFAVGGASSGIGGALYTEAATRATNCTFALNVAQGGSEGTTVFADGVGGGVAANGSQLVLNSCTIASNSASAFGTVAGGGINGASTILLNTLLAFNRTNNGFQNASVTIIDSGHNISSDGTPAWTTANSFNNLDPMLLPLANNGGSTLTMALRANSPALNAANPANAPSVDQRGFLRPSGAGFDIGAYEGPGVPLLQILRENSSTNVVRAAAEPGRTYVLEHSIFVSGWTPVATNVAPPIGPVEFRVPSNLDARFFRLRAD